MKRTEVAIIALLTVALGLIAVFIGTQKFDARDAAIALGETFDMNDGWEITYNTGDKVISDLPIEIGSTDIKKPVYITHALAENQAGLALTLYATNVRLHVFVNHIRVYDTSINEQRSDGGTIIINLPSELSASGNTLEIYLSPQVTADDMSIQTAEIAARDVAITTIVKNSMFPLLCAVLIIIAAVVLMAMDVLRIVSHKRTRGLVIVMLFAFDAIFYSFIRTEIFYLFFGNREFFLTIEEISYMLMPVFVTGFFFRGFKIHFPVGMRVLFYSASAVALIDLVTYSYWGDYHTLLYNANIVWKVIIIVIIMIALVIWKRRRPESRQIFMDESAMFCLLVSILANPTQGRIAGFAFLDTVKVVAITGYFIFMAVQHVQIMLAEYRRGLEQQAKDLEEQNRILEIARNEAEEAKQDAILANEAKSRFLANMSHEIRTPINAVLGMDEMILRETRDKSIKEYAADIRSAGRTLLSLINDILDFSKIESGKMEIVPVEYDFAQMINDLHNMIIPRAQAKDLDFIVEVNENIPRKLFGDDVRIRQCLVNLLTNAVKYTQEGCFWLRVNGVREGDDFTLRCEVEDTGIGIKEEDLPKLFKEYERIEESRNRNIEGTGLGMNITKEMLHLMGSKLQVTSVYGEGSKFWFDVKQVIVDATPVGDIALHHAADEPDEYQGAFIAPDAHILVVDDNAMNRKVFMNLLKATQIQIDEADCGPAAIELAEANPYHFIFMDHMMPEMDGIEAMQAIRALPAGNPNENTPIYVLTANAVSGAREMYLEAGFDGFLSKPVVSAKLEEALRERLPSELILPAPEGEGMDSSSSGDANPMPDDLPSVDGLDWNFAWLHLPGEEMLEDGVKQFYGIILLHADKLDDSYRGLPDEAALDSYRIQVHGMKSAAATIGIVPLAGMAKVLEFAAKDRDIDRIHALHATFVAEWRTYHDKLNGVFGITAEENADEDLPDASYSKTLAILEMLKTAMDDMDVDKADELVEELKKYRYPVDIKDIINRIAAAVSDIDDAAVAEFADEITAKGDFES